MTPALIPTIRNPKSKIRSGFTLIELISVVVIMALVVAVAVIRMDYLVPKYRLRAAAREVAATLKNARTRAATTGRETYMQYDLAQGEYWVLAAFPVPKDEFAPPGTPDEFRYEEIYRQRLPDGVEFVDVILGVNEKYAGGKALIRLSPFGTSSHHIVNLKNKDGREIALKMNGITGAITFHEYRKEADELLEDAGP